MAAALAASLPAPQAAPTAVAPTHDAIPASMAKVVDIETEIPLQVVQLDGMVSSTTQYFFPFSASSHMSMHNIASGRVLGYETFALAHLRSRRPFPQFQSCPKKFTSSMCSFIFFRPDDIMLFGSGGNVRRRVTDDSDSNGTYRS